MLLTGAGDPETVADRILCALDQPISEHRLLVQASIGIAGARPGATLDSVLRDADVAMYTAKQRGKAGAVRYAAGMEEPVQTHIQLGGELRRALDNDEFRVVYQPIMDLQRRRVIGVEALVRWHHPTRGLVAPARVHPGGRADRADRAAGPVRTPRDLPADGCLARRVRAGGAAEGGSERVGHATARPAFRRRRGGRARRQRPARRPAGAGTDRVGGAARSAGLAHPARARPDGRQAGAGRLRHRRVVAEPAARVPGGDRQARQVLRGRHRDRRRRPGGDRRPAGGGPCGHPAGARPGPGHGGRGHRERGPGRRAAASSATPWARVSMLARADEPRTTCPRCWPASKPSPWARADFGRLAGCTRPPT